MATADDYAAWIVRNADRKGTPEFETVAQAYRLAKADVAKPSNPAEADATLQFGPFDTGIAIPASVNNALAGIGKAGYDAARGIGQLVGAVDRKDVDESKRLDAPLMATKAGMAGYIGGNIGMALAPGGALKALGSAAEGVPLLARALTAGGDVLLAPKTIAQGAAGGAALGAVAPVGTDDSRLLNTGFGALAGGAATGIANGVGRLLGPKAPLLTPEQRDLVARAQAAGYTLKPSEMTGKQWQRNLEAAMAQHPATSGRMQAIGVANQDVTNRIVAGALERAGGEIDQGAAGAAAVQGLRTGLEDEAARTGAAYRDLLSGTDVELAKMRPVLQALRDQQAALPADVQGGVKELDTLLGTPGYQPKQVVFKKPEVNPNADDFVTAVRKLGGINPNDERIGATVSRDLPFNAHPQFGPVWSATRGKYLDDMAELLHQNGYLSDRNALDEIIDKLADGEGQHFSHYFTPKPDDPLAAAIDDLTTQMRVKNAPPPKRPGFLRDNPSVPGELAQDMRSAYGAKATRAFDKGDVQGGAVLSGVKDAIDGAIAAAVPAEKQGQFQALNARYGVYKAVEALKPRDQQTFLAALYRGDPEKFYTFLGLAPDGEFKQVARGFLSKLVGDVRDNATGNINAAALGRSIEKVQPQVMRYLGAHSGETLATVGQVGRDVLRDQVNNSGTAQRLFYNSLLSGSGLGLGGYLGSENGGSPGAVLGAGLGLFALPKAVQAAYLSNALRPLLTSGVAGRAGLLGPRALAALPYAGRVGGLLGLNAAQ